MGFYIGIRNKDNTTELSVGYNSGDYSSNMRMKEIAHELKNSLDDLHEAKTSSDI